MIPQANSRKARGPQCIRGTLDKAEYLTTYKCTLHKTTTDYTPSEASFAHS